MHIKKDIAIIGAGPTGLSLAASLAHTSLKIVLLDKLPVESLQNPDYDGREIALTVPTINSLKKLNAWDKINSEFIFPIKQAKVLSGGESYALNFNDAGTLLGYLVSNHLIRKALYEAVCSYSNIEVMPDTAVDAIQEHQSTRSVHLSNQSVIEATLVIAADNRFSESRRKVGIASNTRDFSKVMILCKIEHEREHHHCAYEYFNTDKVVAFLPMSPHASSLVLTVSPDKANYIKRLNEQQFISNLANQFEQQFGKIKAVGQRFFYPLVGVYSQRFIEKRFALIGDAAVGMHPVTAHGFNLGLKGAESLAKEICWAVAQNKDIGSKEILERYQAEHRQATKLMYHGTNWIVSLFTNDTLFAQLLSQCTLRLANQDLLPFKGIIMDYLAGRASPITSLIEKVGSCF
ncbi:5-demethoxyubiquinol-8 5-hydroxylase UbiM [Legionella sp. PATHC038]|uniref:5-demethoxyubiquinol-8 5-hydroxylase UbiM n=1 Tax=Legionella sheltonii TaxID=2992041 RepID=UPI00224427C5|nr:5-demethoxyubiquinol-8 5-hydroxylase UbiM [Legionella sp. PATHC038]MCW8398992.1 5-demethoxyubiquinol-8 5-hydroxylase UbiM [Legionella sp. PATHC038]